MGRATADSIGRPLPGRTTKILTRKPAGKNEISALHDVESSSGKIFLCGGAEVYANYLFECDELLITHIKFEATGDKHLPYFAHKFKLSEVIEENSLFKIARYLRIEQ
jgi:dihydrofolate reductase